MNRKTVLVVDDESLVRKLVGLILEGEFEVIQADCGTMAVSLARTERPDLVLLDMGLPDMDGLEACAILKRDPSTNSVVVVVCSGGPRMGGQLAAEGCGADGYLPKPFSPESLLSTVRRLLG